MRCLTPQASDTILGQGYAASGHNAQTILKSQRGVGILLSGEAAEPELVRGHYYDDNQVAVILRRAYELRREAGTLPVAVEPEVTILDHMVKAASATGRGVITRAELFTYLAAVDEQYARGEAESDAAYNARVGRALAAALDAAGVTVEAVKVPTEDGSRSMGYRLEDLNAAR
jgi:S-DNA-T family DNA segregation ATPase FtsK/SpoIIIE